LWKFPIINKIGEFIAKNLAPIMQFQTDKFQVIPETIEIGYNESVTVELGLIDMLAENQTGFSEVEDGIMEFLNARYFDFRAEFPDGSSEGWYVNFAPSRLYFEEGKVLKTKVTISLNSPPGSGPAIQSGRIRINITDTWVFGNVWYPEGWEDWYPGQKIFWFMMAATLGFGTFSGKVLPEYFTFDILAKVKPYRNVNIEALPLIKLKPDEIASIPISVENLGNYNDTFGFRITSKYDDIELVDPGFVSLRPGKKTETLLGVNVPELILDVGTLYSVNIEVYSLEEPNVTIASQKVFLETQGIYVSEINSLFFILFIIIVAFGVSFLLFKRRSVMSNICKKPDKPWEIPEEKKYLEKLKEKDKKEYGEILKMMEDEYKSALLWYEHYCKAIFKKRFLEKKKARRLKAESSKIIKKSEKDIQEKPVEKLEAKEQVVEEIQKPEEVVKEPERERVDRETEMEKRKREKTLLRIKREQEKQRRKFK